MEKFISHRSWGKYMEHLEGPLREVKPECRQRERQDLGSFIRVCGWSTLEFPGQGTIGQVKQKRAGF